MRTQEQIGHNEILDFEMISFEGNLPNWQAGQPGGPKLVGAVCSWQLAVGSWQLAVGSWLLAVGCWLLAVELYNQPTFMIENCDR